jgi:hypothetical protein
MTCIVGIVDKGKIYIGGDSAGLTGWDLCVRNDKKVFVNNGFAMGFSSSFRMGQLLAYALKPPEIKPGDDLMRFMAVDFINAVRECLKSGGWASREKETENGGNFLPPRCLAWVGASCPLPRRSAPPTSQRFLGSAEGGRFFVPA